MLEFSDLLGQPYKLHAVDCSTVAEEINRRLTSVVTDLHFAPTEWSRGNLVREGIPADRVVVTGNPVIDALQSAANMPPNQGATSLLDHLGLAQDSDGPSRLVVITAHRRPSE